MEQYTKVWIMDGDLKCPHGEDSGTPKQAMCILSDMETAGICKHVFRSSETDGDPSPPYSAGDILGIKETWAYVDGKYVYRADPENEMKKILWVQSTRIPEEAIRLSLSIRAIRQERLQDISDDDIREEGIWLSGVIDPRFAFSDKWDMSLSKPMRNRYSWDDNPMVWVLEFDRVSDTEVEHDGI